MKHRAFACFSFFFLFFFFGHHGEGGGVMEGKKRQEGRPIMTLKISEMKFYRLNLSKC